MAVPTHFKFTVRGIFKGSPETWSFGFHMSRDNTAAFDADLGSINEAGVTTAVAALLGSGMIANQVEVTDWRAYVIGTNGKMQGNGPLLHEFAPDELKGQGTTNIHPPQVALAVTTVGVNRGPARFGRFYLPGPCRIIDGTWRMTLADTGVYEQLATQFLKDVSNQIDMQALGSSVGLNVSPGPVGSATGTRQEIDHVEVGRAFDTLRNRRKSLLEERVVGGHIDW